MRSLSDSAHNHGAITGDELTSVIASIVDARTANIIDHVKAAKLAEAAFAAWERGLKV